MSAAGPWARPAKIIFGGHEPSTYTLLQETALRRTHCSSKVRQVLCRSIFCTGGAIPGLVHTLPDALFVPLYLHTAVRIMSCTHTS